MVAEIDFADGFDAPEPLAWGLTAAQLGTVAAGAVLAYLALHSPLARIVAVPLAVLAGSAGLTLAVARRDGRALVSWGTAAARFWTRPRRGLLVVVQAPNPGDPAVVPSVSRRRETPIHDREDGLAPSPARPGWGPRGEVESPRRVPLVLLPEPVAPSAVREPEAVRAGSLPPPVLGVADATLLEARDRGPGAEATIAIRPLRGVDPVWLGMSHAAPRVPRRVTFFSLSGGAGRTTLAVEVAGLLAGQAHRGNAWEMLAPPHVALVDLDLTSPRAGIRLGVPAPAEWGLADGGPVDTEVERLRTVHRSGLVVLPGPARVLGPGCCDRADVVHRLAAAVDELERRGCDTIVLDVAGDLSALTRWALHSAHDIFVVLTPTAGGVYDAYRSAEALRRLGLRQRLRYVINRAAGGVPALGEAMSDLGGTVVAEIPDDPELEHAEMEHRLVGLERSGPTASALRRLAATIEARSVAVAGDARAPGARRLLRRWVG